MSDWDRLRLIAGSECLPTSDENFLRELADRLEQKVSVGIPVSFVKLMIRMAESEGHDDPAEWCLEAQAICQFCKIPFAKP